jgi:hypothetical protein
MRCRSRCSLASPRSTGRRQMVSRAADAGIKIALVDRYGSVVNVEPK